MYIIGIAGGTGSGKTTVVRKIMEALQNENVAVIPQDSYYNDNSLISMEDRRKINYDHPDAFETDMLIDHIRKLRDGQSVECPVYDYTVHNRSDKTITIHPADVILVEGIMVLQNDELRSLLDIKVYVEADADERILRRVIRDVKERGRDVEGIAKQYLTTVKPMHYLYVEPTRALADIVINSGLNDVAFDLIRSKITLLLQQ